MELNKYIDHTILKATASQKDIEKLKKFYNGYGSFDLPNFVNFDTKIF